MHRQHANRGGQVNLRARLLLIQRPWQQVWEFRSREHRNLTSVHWQRTLRIPWSTPLVQGWGALEMAPPHTAVVRRPVQLGRRLIGRASCREIVCQYVYISVVAFSFKKNI